MAEKLLRPTDVEDMGIAGINTLAYWRHQGTGPKWAKLGRRVVYRESDVLAWVEAQFSANVA